MEEKLLEKLKRYIEFNKQNAGRIRKHFWVELKRIDEISELLAEGLLRMKDLFLGEVFSEVLGIQCEYVRLNIGLNIIEFYFQNIEDTKRFKTQFIERYKRMIFEDINDGVKISLDNMCWDIEKVLFVNELLKKVYEKLIKIVEQLPDDPVEFVKQQGEFYKFLVYLKLK